MAIEPTKVRDLVIIIPGIMGSELIDAKGNKVWSVSAGAMVNAIKTLGKSLIRLELPKGLGDNEPGDGVRPVALLSSLHVIPGLWSPISGYDGLVNFLRSSRFQMIEADPRNPDVVPNLIPFPYDWRLSNSYNGKLLAKVAQDALERWRKQPGMGEAKLVLVCHSMGGLIARWFAEQEQGAELIRSVITIGTPHRGAFKSLATIVNGLEVGIGPLQLGLTRFVRSLPSLYQLLPQYNCLVTDEGRVGVSAQLSLGLDQAMLENSTSFHKGILGSESPSYALHKIVGIRQPTPTTGRFVDGKIISSDEIDGSNQGGDGTVPVLAAQPIAGRGAEVHEIADQHGVLQGARSLHDLMDGILSREEIIWQNGPAGSFGVEMAEVWPTTQAPFLRVVNRENRRFLATLADETGRKVFGPVPVQPEGIHFEHLPEGGYMAIVSSNRPGGPTPVTKPFLVIDSI